MPEDYVRGMHQVYGDDLERYMEEIFCDAQAGISRRYAPMNEELRGRISETAGQIRQEYSGENESRSPPREGGERYSTDKDTTERREDDELLLGVGQQRKSATHTGKQTERVGSELRTERRRGTTDRTRNRAGNRRDDTQTRDERVSTKDLVLEGGMTDKSIELVPEELWSEYGCADICEEIRAMGYEPVPFLGVIAKPIIWTGRPWTRDCGAV